MTFGSTSVREETAMGKESMTIQVLAVSLALLLSVNCLGDDQISNRALEQVRRLDTHSPVEVRFVDGSRLRGWIGEISDTGFALSREEKNHMLTNSRVAFNQVRDVKQVGSVKPSHTVRNVLIGVGITVVTVGVIFGIWIRTHGLG